MLADDIRPYKVMKNYLPAVSTRLPYISGETVMRHL